MLFVILTQQEKRFSLNTFFSQFYRKASWSCRAENAAQTKLSEAQSELDRQGLKMQCSNRAPHEPGIQFHSQRMELHQVNQSDDHSQKEKSWSCTELEMTDRALEEERTKRYQEIEE